MRILSLASDVPISAPLRNESKTADSIVNAEAKTTNVQTLSTTASAIPTVVLDADVVSDNMAAKLCTSFLGHVLFLKNQIPLSVPSVVFFDLPMMTFHLQSYRPVG